MDFVHNRWYLGKHPKRLSSGKGISGKGKIKNGNIITTTTAYSVSVEEPYGYHFPIPTIISLGKNLIALI